VRAILIPVKHLSRAKQRLSGVLPQDARTRLAQAMLEDVFLAVAGVRSAEAIFVVSSDSNALAAARDNARAAGCADAITWQRADVAHLEPDTIAQIARERGHVA